MTVRVYVHKFDWDDARRRRAAGGTYTALAREYGVHINTVRLACNDVERQKSNARVSAYQRSGICRDCGAAGVVPLALAHGTRNGRCRPCAAKAAASSVREDTLRCVTCREWKADADFPSNRTETARRGRHTSCRPCLTELKRGWRARNREKDNAYHRDYKRRRRAAA